MERKHIFRTLFLFVIISSIAFVNSAFAELGSTPPTITTTSVSSVVAIEAAIPETSGVIGAVFVTTGRTPIQVSLTKGSVDYSNVRVVVEGLSDGVQLIAQDTTTSTWYNIVKTGWGPGSGFPLFTATTPVYLVANTASNYTATIKLVDVLNSNSVLASATVNVTANVPDTSVPTATVSHDEVLKTITYHFSEPMKLTNNDGSAIAGTNEEKLAVYAVTNLDYGTATKVPGIAFTSAIFAGNDLTITYTGNLVAQVNTKYVVDAWGYKISDLAGNKMASDISQMFDVTGVDTIFPTATVTQSGQTITYTFSEPMQLTNNDGTAITGTIADKLAVYSVTGLDYGTASVIPGIIITNADLVGNVLTITYTGSLVAQVNTKYVVDAWGYKISDLAGHKMLSDISQMFDVTGVDTIPPTLNITGFTSNSSAMNGSIAGGYTLNTDGNANTKYQIQFAAGSVALENLKNEAVGLFLQPTVGQAAALVNYYSTNPAPYLDYLNGAAAGSQPFAYIKTNGTAIQLLDGAKKALASIETDMVIPGDAPAGIYTLKGTIHDLANNSTEVTYILNVVIPTNLSAYSAALAAVIQTNYTTATWATYQLVVSENVKTSANSQAQVDAATANITTAQRSLVTVLADAKSAAVSQLSAYKNSTDYRTAEQTTLANAITAGNTAINGAANIGAVTTALNNAKGVIDAIKNNVILTAEELVTSKSAAVSQLSAYKNSTDYRTAEQTTLANAITAGNTAINGAANIGAVTTALNNAKGVIDAIKTNAQLTAEELADAKTTAYAVLTDALATYTQANYTAENWVTLAGFKSSGDKAIGAAADLASVTSAKTTATTGMAGVVKLTPSQTKPDAETGSVNVNSTTPEVVITNPTQPVVVTVTGGVNATLNVGEFIDTGSGSIPQITIVSDVAGVAIPATTITSADPAWNGIIAAPTVTTVTLPNPSGETRTLNTAIEVGFSGAKLSFVDAVRILLPTQAGKKVGYTRTGTAFTEITNVCTADSQLSGDSLSVDGDCKIDVGSDLVIWTKHFTTFATYTQTKNPSTIGSGGGSSYRAPTITPVTNSLDIKALEAMIVKLQEQIRLQQSSVGEVLGDSTYSFGRHLRLGAQGSDVMELQSKLRAGGYFTFATNTGYFGQLTMNAVKMYQKAHGIISTGYVGDLTLAELNK